MKNFTRVPNKLLNLTQEGNLDCYDIAVYFAIFKHKNSITKKCFPSTRILAKLLKISDKTVRVRIIKLEKCGILNRTYKRGAVTHYVTAVNGGNNCGSSYLHNKTNNNTNNKEKKMNININKEKEEKERIAKNIKALNEVRKNLLKTKTRA